MLALLKHGPPSTLNIVIYVLGTCQVEMYIDQTYGHCLPFDDVSWKEHMSSSDRLPLKPTSEMCFLNKKRKKKKKKKKTQETESGSCVWANSSLASLASFAEKCPHPAGAFVSCPPAGMCSPPPGAARGLVER